MKFICLIFILIHFLNCTDIPEHLECIDNLCQKTISTGRLIKSVDIEHGTLESVKANSRVLIKGKNHGNKNTLWLIDYNGFYGFIDFSFIKESKDSFRNDLTVCRNPHFSGKVSDETEEPDEEPVEFKPSKQIKQDFSHTENDETENFSEENQQKIDKIKEQAYSGDSLVKNIGVNNDIKIDNSNSKTIDISLNENSKTLDDKISGSPEIKSDDKNKVNELNQEINASLSVKQNLQYQDKEEIPKNELTEQSSIEEPQQPIKANDKPLNTLQNQPVKETVINNAIVQDNKLINGQNDVDVKNSVNKIEVNTDNAVNVEEAKEPLKSVETNQELEKKSSEAENTIKKELDELKKTNEEIKSDPINQQPNLMQENGRKESNVDKEVLQKSNPINPQPNNSLNPPQENIVKDSNVDKEVLQKSSPINSQPTSEKDSNVDKEVPQKSNPIDPDNSLNPPQENNEKDSNVDKKVVQENTIAQQQTDLSSETKPILNNEKSILEKQKEANTKTTSNGSVDTAEKMENQAKIDSKVVEEPYKVQINTQVKDIPPEETVKSKETLNIGDQQKRAEVVANIPASDSVENLNGIKDQQVITSEDGAIEPERSLEEKDGKTNDSDATKEKLAIQMPNADLESESLLQTNNKVELEGSVTASDNPVNTDPWLTSGDKSGPDYDKEMINAIKSPVIKLILKLDLLSQFLIKSMTLRLGLDSSSKISQFSHNWLQMSLENLIFISTLLVVLFAVVYTPKIFKFNRDWKTEFTRQSQIMAELESKLQSIEEVRHKLTVQNHNFEKVIDEYKQQINEIQDDAEKNKKTVMGEIAKLKKTHETNMKNLTNDFNNKTQQYLLLENDLTQRLARIDYLEEEKRNMENLFDNEKIEMNENISRIEKDLDKTNSANDELKETLRQKIAEIEQLTSKIEDLNQDLMDKSDSYITLEKSFENLKVFEDLNYEEYNMKKEICLDLSNTKDKLEVAEQRIKGLESDLIGNCQQIAKLEDSIAESDRIRNEYEVQKNNALALQEAAETKLKVLSDYFKSKEVEMAKTLGHQVIESSQTMDQVDFLKHRIQILETDNEEMTKIIQKLKSEIKEAQSFAAKCKSEANEQINNLFMKCTNLERNLILEKEESKKLRTKLSHYCGPTPSRNVANVSYNHNKDRPPSRQSMTSESSGFIPLPPMIPMFLPQSPMINSPVSGRNSVNSKKSNNT